MNQYRPLLRFYGPRLRLRTSLSSLPSEQHASTTTQRARKADGYRDSSQFTTDNLAQYDGLLFLMTSGQDGEIGLALQQIWILIS